MNRHVRASAPRLYKLASHSKRASESFNSVTTVFSKRAYLINTAKCNAELVDEAIKLGSAVLQSVKATKEQEEYAKSRTKERSKALEKDAMSPGRALALGAAITAVPALAANYTINRASDNLDAKMLAIPGLAATTVAAILAARNMTNSAKAPVEKSTASELETALNAKDIVDKSIEVEKDPDTIEELSKMSSISIDHIAELISDILL
jgi:hypothetical protein